MKTQTPKHKSTNGERGFTLIETTIASLVMLVGALGCASLFVFSLQNNVGGSERALAMAVAQQQLEQIRSVKYADATLNVGTTTSSVRNGERPYTVQRTVALETNSNGSAQNMKRITITVTPETGQTWMRSSVVLVTFRSTLSSGPYLVSN
ncbi:MAG TPA: type II secretion system protein [Pyrinomonadaceae bacterium]|nr:type II secretion system protein [Pyrinomonadaceae bacterium]